MKKLLTLPLVLFLLAQSGPPAHAQTAPPLDVRFACAKAGLGITEVPCVALVNINIFGLDLSLTFPRSITISGELRNQALLPEFISHRITITGQTLQVGMSNQSPTRPLAPLQLFYFRVNFNGPPPATFTATLEPNAKLYTRDTTAMPSLVYTNTGPVGITIEVGKGLNAYNPFTPPPPIPLPSTTVAPPPTSTTSPPTTTTTAAPVRTIHGSFLISLPAPGVHFAASQKCFADDFSIMSETEWITICEAKRLGIIEGINENGQYYFRPEKATNRAEVSKLMTQGVLLLFGQLEKADFTKMETTIAARYQARQKPTAYSDINFSAGIQPWFAKYVALLTETGVVSGYPDGTFRPELIPNRAEGYKFLVETVALVSPKVKAKLKELSKPGSNREWFSPYLETLSAFKVEFSPFVGNLMPRKEMVITLVNLLNAAKE